MKYSLPLVLISVNTDADKHAENITSLCERAWKGTSAVETPLGGNTTLRIVPMGVDKSCEPQIIAVIFSNVISSGNGSTFHRRSVGVFGHEERKNVTCFVNALGMTYQHVFLTPVSNFPEDTVCAENIQTVRTVSSTPDGTVYTREEMTHTTKAPTTTNVMLNQTNPFVNEDRKERSPLVAIVTMLAVVAVVLVALSVTYVIRRKYCYPPGNQARRAAGGSQGAPIAAPFLDHHWIMSGPGLNALAFNLSHLAGARGTALGGTTQSTSSSADQQEYNEIPDDYYDQQSNATSMASQTGNDYSQIPDEHFNYYNTRPGAQHPYWQIPDEHFNYYNTRPGAQHHYWEIPDGYYNPRPLSYPLDYSVTFHAAGAKVSIPSSTRLGGWVANTHPTIQPLKSGETHRITSYLRMDVILTSDRTECL
ncbi:Hypp2235 [Branchiostoma lanceolatum]|uniref:Hypp2235 protein n=1 Tax=Branchiostoma lanceolatum TaxID=7740 RepID=A0A8J9ZQY3_BRALA|nr:Hypp2235 [Branchiostoma lanceolatum]